MPFVLAFLAAVLLAAAPVRAEEGVTISHAIAEFGEPARGPDFTHFDYADPSAPKGGTITIGTEGSFDTLNFYPLQGESPRNIGLLYNDLMAGPQDEVSVYYGLIAETVEYPDDRSWIIFNLRPQARFNDGVPVTAEDVAWSFDKLREVGDPFQVSFYEDVTGVEVLGEHRIRFDFSTRGVMKPLVRVAQLTVLPRHWWEAEGRDIGSGTLEPPLGSGPYRLVRVEGGRSLEYERVPDYWGADLAVTQGFWNFDRIRYDYYRDRDVQLEAFKGGAYDFRLEYTSLYWATGYDVPAVADGRIIKEEIPGEDFRGMQSYMFNTRLARFADPRVRQAITMLYDFEWVNENLFYGLYERMTSYFNATGYSSSGLPDDAELTVLEPFRDRLPAAVFDEPFTLPRTDGTGNIRQQIRDATRLLAEAGWEIRDGAMTSLATGEALTFEILLRGAIFERVTQPFIDNLARVGIIATMRTVDSAQWQQRYQDRDFEVIAFAYTFYPPPGTELRSYFGSAAADVPGSANLAGIKDPVVDALIEEIVASSDLATKRAATRALDRVLLSGQYVVPQWMKTGTWAAWWDRFGFPAEHPPYDFGLGNGIAFQPTWWIDAEKDARLARGP